MFKDVKENDWARVDIEKAAKYGLLMGVAPGVFEPDRPITRREMATIAVRLYEKTNEDFVEVIEQITPAIVQIENEDTGGLGSGTFIHPDGFILTNCHVVANNYEEWQNNNKITIQIPKMVGIRSAFPGAIAGTTYAMGPVLAFDPEIDLAIVWPQLSGKEGKYNYYLKINSSLPSPSQKVIAVGSPLGLINSVSEGVVSAIRKTSSRILIQTDASINPGNSGGALVDLQGMLIGVPTEKYVHVAVEGLGFAISTQNIKEFILANIKNGKLPERLANIF